MGVTGMVRAVVDLAVHQSQWLFLPWEVPLHPLPSHAPLLLPR